MTMAWSVEHLAISSSSKANLHNPYLCRHHVPYRLPSKLVSKATSHNPIFLQAGEALQGRLSRQPHAAGAVAAAAAGAGGAAVDAAAGAAGVVRAALMTTAAAPSQICQPRSRATLTRQAEQTRCRARLPRL